MQSHCMGDHCSYYMYTVVDLEHYIAMAKLLLLWHYLKAAILLLSDACHFITL